jgi:hypothetical protein
MSAYPVTADKIADLRDKFRDASVIPVAEQVPPLSLAQQFPQLGDVAGDPPRLILGQSKGNDPGFLGPGPYAGRWRGFGGWGHSSGPQSNSCRLRPTLRVTFVTYRECV